MTIQWFPGHMNTTRQTLERLMPKSDVVIELLDARLPASSSNPLLDEVRRNVQGKGPDGRPGDLPCITVLTKTDLADPEATAAWRAHFHEARGVKTLALNLKEPREAKNLPKLAKRLAPHRVERDLPVRVFVVGIPNVGKSTLINALMGRSVAKTGDEPAVTKGPQEVKLQGGLVLTDTPGILWPKFEDPAVGMNLAISGAIKDTAIDYDQIGPGAALLLLRRYPDRLAERYKLKTLPEADAPDAAVELLEAVGRKRGCLVPGNEVDMTRASELLLRELRSGKLGRVSLEWPGS